MFQFNLTSLPARNNVLSRHGKIAQKHRNLFIQVFSSENVPDMTLKHRLFNSHLTPNLGHDFAFNQTNIF
jgi:hypothetical protein